MDSAQCGRAILAARRLAGWIELARVASLYRVHVRVHTHTRAGERESERASEPKACALARSLFLLRAGSSRSIWKQSSARYLSARAALAPSGIAPHLLHAGRRLHCARPTRARPPSSPSGRPAAGRRAEQASGRASERANERERERQRAGGHALPPKCEAGKQGKPASCRRTEQPAGRPNS